LAALAEITRGECIESIHYGSVAVVDTHENLIYRAGDPGFLTFTRSTLKPFQAYPFLRDGGAARFGFTECEIALMCASHSGEPMHIDTVRSILQKTGCDEHHLQCGCHVPSFYAATGMPVPDGKVFDQLYNNCSGKHAGFLAYCVQHGQPLESYLEPAHPLQQAVKESVADICGLPESKLERGVDGCSAPNYAMPLANLAGAYAKLAQGADGTLESICRAMTAHPDIVSGAARNDLALMRAGAGDWVAKGGAEGVQAIGIRSAGLGVAIKIVDGDSRALPSVTISVLQQLGVMSDDAIAALADRIRPRIMNLRGIPVGEIWPAVRLMRA